MMYIYKCFKQYIYIYIYIEMRRASVICVPWDMDFFVLKVVVHVLPARISKHIRLTYFKTYVQMIRY